MKAMFQIGRSFCAHHFIFSMLLSRSMIYGWIAGNDIFCLKSIKDSLEDPHGALNSWDFINNNTQDFICGFAGVECWVQTNRIMNLDLSSKGLKGQFPRTVQNCSGLTRLDLSLNQLSGTIPADINWLLLFVTTLNLSSNEFSGTIPEALANCSYLNSLSLDRNRLSGQIPGLFSSLTRLKTFIVTNNLLSGPVPYLPNITVDSYANNSGLCGVPLPACGTKMTTSAVIAGAAIGGVTLGFGVAFILYLSLTMNKKRRTGETN